LAATEREAVKSLAVGTMRRKMRERPEYRNELGTAEAQTLIDRVKAWRADYDAVNAEKEAEAKAKREARLTEIRVKVAARPQS
jgi:hypothetical protein